LFSSELISSTVVVCLQVAFDPGNNRAVDFSSPIGIVIRVLVAMLGFIVVGSTFLSAVKLVVVPKGTSQRITRAVFVIVRTFIGLYTRRAQPWTRRDTRLAYYAPVSLVLLPFAWVTLIIIGFAGVQWALDPKSVADAFYVSGSSMLTLGVMFRRSGFAAALSFLQAAIGLIIVALLISYLPAIYAAYTRRELMVGLLESRAGLPPSPVTMLARFHAVGGMDQVDPFFSRWEEWFVEVEESHTNFAALNFFRSPRPERSWITAAGCVLDTAALRMSVLDMPRSPQAALCVRAGFLSLRRIADYFMIPHNDDPNADHPISISRQEFDQMYEQLGASGLPLRHDREQAWIDYRGWRVNYDTVLIRLTSVVQAPIAHWSSDREIDPFVPRLLRTRKRVREHHLLQHGLRTGTIETVAAGKPPATPPGKPTAR
jgi:hypothetical protein